MLWTSIRNDGPSVFWMRTCPQSDSQTQRLSSSSVAVYSAWMTESWRAGEAGANICVLIGEVFMTALFVKVCMKQLYYTLLATFFLAALNIMTYHPVPARYIAGGNISSRSLLQSSATWAWAAGWGEPENLDVIKPDVETLSDGARLVFPAIWLSRNEACWRAFVIISAEVWEWQHRDGRAGILQNKHNSLTRSQTQM